MCIHVNFSQRKQLFTFHTHLINANNEKECDGLSHVMFYIMSQVVEWCQRRMKNKKIKSVWYFSFKVQVRLDSESSEAGRLKDSQNAEYMISDLSTKFSLL